MKLSIDAVRAWTFVLRQAFWHSTGIQQIIVPVLVYRPGEDSSGGELITHLAPLVLEEIGPHTIEGHLSAQPIKLYPEDDVALSTRVLLLGKSTTEFMALDIIDVEPGHVFTPGDVFTKGYHLLKTSGSYHLYPKEHVFRQNGGHCVQDSQWKRGYIRVTESEGKGPITQVTA